MKPQSAALGKRRRKLFSPVGAKQEFGRDRIVVSPLQGSGDPTCLPRAALDDERRFALPWAGMFRPLQGKTCTNGPFKPHERGKRVSLRSPVRLT